MRFAAFAVLLVGAIVSWSVFWGSRISDMRNDDFFVAAYFHADGESRGGVYRFSISDFGSVLDFKEIEARRVLGIAEDSMIQGFCSSGGFSGAVAVWGKPGAQPSSARAYVFGNGSLPKEVSASPEYRFRDCGFGRTASGEVFATVSHGSWTLAVRSIREGKTRTLRIPFVSETFWPDGVALGHFLEFADLDSDGNDEIYVSVTSPFSVSEWGSLGKADGMVFRTEMSQGEWNMKETWTVKGAYARRLKAIRGKDGDRLFALYEGLESKGEDGLAVPSVVLYELSNSSWSLAWERLTEFPGHSECKTLTDFKMADSDLQIGCDGPALYELRENSGRFEIVRKREFGIGKTEERDFGKDVQSLPWQRRSIHAVEWSDRNGDGFADLVIGINNDGLRLLDSKDVRSQRSVRFEMPAIAKDDHDESFFLIMDAVPFVGNADELGRALSSESGATLWK